MVADYLLTLCTFYYFGPTLVVIVMVREIELIGNEKKKKKLGTFGLEIEVMP